jgi:succinyl-diaminopimelate desuccinylase
VIRRDRWHSVTPLQLSLNHCSINVMNEELKRRVEAKRDDVAELTAALIRFPTVNPPGEGYLPAPNSSASGCCGAALKSNISAPKALPGDTDRYPRWNVVCRRRAIARADRPLQFPYRRR